MNLKSARSVTCSPSNLKWSARWHPDPVGQPYFDDCSKFGWELFLIIADFSTLDRVLFHSCGSSRWFSSSQCCHNHWAFNEKSFRSNQLLRTQRTTKTWNAQLLWLGFLTSNSRLVPKQFSSPNSATNVF